jgi:sugar (pentulose or hexulose) kinase
VARLALGIDLGSSAVKALVVDESGVPLASARRPAPVRAPRGGPELAREFSSERLWQTVAQAVCAALEHVRIRGQAVAVIGVTSQRQGLAFLDAEHRPLYLAPNGDLRAVFEGAAQDEAHRDEFYRVTGHLPPFFMASAKLRWMEAHHPEEYQRIRWVLSLADWVVLRLTGVVAAERALAAEAGLLDVTSGGWANGLLQSLGLRDDVLPVLVSAGTVVGRLGREGALGLGLPVGLPVVAAGPDTQCGLIGMGVVASGQVGVLAGWSMTAQQVTVQPRYDPRVSAWVGLHVADGRWVSEVNLGDAGAAYQWAAQTLYGGRAAIARLEREASAAEVGSQGVLAFLGAGPLDMRRIGFKPGGFLFPTPAHHAGVSRASLGRAALEGLAFAVRQGVERLEAMGNAKVDSFGLGGGMARGVFPQMAADGTGREVDLPVTPDVSAYGAALTALHAAHGQSLDGAARQAAGGLRRLTPGTGTALAYNDVYARWQEARKRVESHLPG